MKREVYMDVVELSPEQVRQIADDFYWAGREGRSVRVAVDGGFKYSVAQQVWTPPIGLPYSRP